MKGIPRGVVTCALVILVLLIAGSAVFPAVASPPGSPEITQSGGSLSAEIFDLFNVPYRGWWDFRGQYGDFPLTADCFSFENIPGGAGSPNPAGTGVCDTGLPGYTGETWVQYPYMNPITWFHTGRLSGRPPDIQIYAPYRMRMTGTGQPGATLAQPVYLPVFNPAEPAGTTLRMRWDFNYLTKAETEAVDAQCGSTAAFGYDGFVSRNIFTATMDFQESKRIFGDVTTPAFSPTANPGTQQWTNPANGFTSNNVYATTASNGFISEYGSYGVLAVASPIGKVEVGLEGKTAGDALIFSPTANPGTQQWTNPANGFTSNNVYATTATIGSISEYGSYGIPQPAVPSPISRVEVGLEGKTLEDDDVRVEFSTDGGVSWTAAGTVNLGTTDTTTFFDVTSLRTWTYTLLDNANFRTRIVYALAGATASMNSVDWVPARVTVDDNVRVEFSTDGGVSWTVAGTVNLGTVDTTTFFDVTSLRTWTYALLNNANFRTRIVYVQVGATASVDWVPVRVKADVPEYAQLWWDQNTDPRCTVKRPVESRWEAFMQAQGGSANVMGPYDIVNSYEYFYQPFMTNLYDQTIDPVTGETTVVIDHVTWGSEVLFPRWFYWGSTLYLDPGPDGVTGTPDDIINAERYPHSRNGWWKWEFAWIEDLHFDTTIRAASQDFTLATVMQYHFTAFANPGPDGILHSNGPDLTPGTGDDVVSTDDIAEWLWMPLLTDYVYGNETVSWSPKHKISELDPYAGPDDVPFTPDDLRFTFARPGMVYYGTQFPYEYPPAEWDLEAGDTVVVRLPNGLSPNGGAVTFIDPYSPLTSAADGSNLIMKSSKIGFFRSTPALPAGSSASDSDGDGILDTISLVGPIDWGAPSLPRWGFPSLEFTPAAPPIQVSIAAPWTQLFAGQTMGLTVTASVSGSPLAGAAVTATLTGAGTLTPPSGLTDSSGKFQTTVAGSTSGTTITVAATVSMSGYASGTSSYAISIVPSQSMAIAVSSNRREMMGSEVATIRVNLTSGTAGVTGALLTPSTPIPGSSFGSIREIGSGNYEFGWTAPMLTRQTFVPINVLAKAGGYLDVSGRVVILVDPNKTNLIDPTQLFLLVRAPATSLRVGETMTVTVYLYTIEGYVVSGATLALLRVGPGTVSAVTDRLNGEYTFVYTAPASVPSPTGVLITITASKLGYLNGTARLAITVTP